MSREGAREKEAPEFGLSCDRCELRFVPARKIGEPEEIRGMAARVGWSTGRVGRKIFDYCPRHTREVDREAGSEAGKRRRWWTLAFYDDRSDLIEDVEGGPFKEVFGTERDVVDEAEMLMGSRGSRPEGTFAVKIWAGIDVGLSTHEWYRPRFITYEGPQTSVIT